MYTIRSLYSPKTKSQKLYLIFNLYFWNLITNWKKNGYTLLTVVIVVYYYFKYQERSYFNKDLAINDFIRSSIVSEYQNQDCICSICNFTTASIFKNRCPYCNTIYKINSFDPGKSTKIGCFLDAKKKLILSKNNNLIEFIVLFFSLGPTVTIPLLHCFQKIAFLPITTIIKLFDYFKNDKYLKKYYYGVAGAWQITREYFFYNIVIAYFFLVFSIAFTLTFFKLVKFYSFLNYFYLKEEFKSVFLKFFERLLSIKTNKKIIDLEINSFPFFKLFFGYIENGIYCSFLLLFYFFSKESLKKNFKLRYLPYLFLSIALLNFSVNIISADFAILLKDTISYQKYSVSPLVEKDLFWGITYSKKVENLLKISCQTELVILRKNALLGSLFFILGGFFLIIMAVLFVFKAKNNNLLVIYFDRLCHRCCGLDFSRF